MTSSNPSSGKSLYHRLGGYDGVAAIIDDLLAKMRDDFRFSRFGMGRSANSRDRARQLLVDQICALACGPCIYIGRDMKTSHAGLRITEDEWAINLQYAREALQKHGVGESEQGEFLELFARYKRNIVEG